MVKPLRILHAPADVAGQAQGLSSALRALGYRSNTLTFQTPRFGFHADENLRLERFHVPLQYAVRLFYFLRNANRYDIFHFYFGESLLPWNLDLPFLKLLGKRMFMTFQGCDIRLQDATLMIGETTHHLHHACVCNAVSDRRKKSKIRFIHRFVKKTYVLNPDLLLSDPHAELLPYSHLDPRAWHPTQKPPMRPDGPFRIVHAPTNRILKGTSFILQSVEELRKKGYKIDLRLIENLSHEDMLDRCKDADLAIDQLLIGWYGGFSVEMMALGIPVICYIDTRLAVMVSYFQKLPFINATTKTLSAVIENTIQNRMSLPELCRRSRAFVERIHDPAIIAQRLNHDYTNA